MNPVVDLVLHNGRVYTMDPGLAVVQAVAISGPRIVAVGNDGELAGLAGPGVRTVNLDGRVVVPGFIDSHLHVMQMALLRQGVDLHGASSLGKVLHRVSNAAARTPPGDWVMGWGWDQYLWPNPSLPGKAHLDAICPDRHILLQRVDGHSAWLNSLALKQVGITEDSPDPPGGTIGRDPQTGETTGILYDAALFSALEKLPSPDQETLQNLIREALADCQRLGLVGLHDAVWDAKTFQQGLAAYQTLYQREELPVRILVTLPATGLSNMIELGLRSGFGDEMLRLGGIKLFADGSLCSQTALVREPYVGRPGYHGLAVTSKEETREWVGQAARAGISSHVHAIGDRAISDVLDIYEEFAAYRAGLALPQRIEHATLMGPATRQRVARLGCMTACQPLHITDDMVVAEGQWGEERCYHVHPLRANLDAGIRMAFGSDCPVADKNPLKGIHAAVTRQNVADWPSGGWHPEQRITVEEAVWCYTVGSATASGEAHLKGSITPGKLADMVVLDQDIFEMEPEEIAGVEPTMTIFDGRMMNM